MILGYARVSTLEQELDNQVAALKAAGCEKLFTEKRSGADAARPVLKELLAWARDGQDIVVVTRLDRLARSTSDLLSIADRLQTRQIGLRSIAEPWADTTSPAGRMVMTVFAGIAEFERALILERTAHGRAEAKKRGKHLGRPSNLNLELWAELKPQLIDRKKSVNDLVRLLKVSRATIYRQLQKDADAAALTNPDGNDQGGNPVEAPTTLQESA